MAFTYGFYNSLNGDRRYKAEDFGTLIGSLITDGVFENIGSKLFTTAGTGMDINVGTGKAWFDNTWNVNDSVMVLTVPQSDITRPRYDTVVLEVNTDISVRENKIKIVSGDPAVTPTKPVLTNTDKVHQHPLAHILVSAAATSITASNIEIVVGQTACPFCTGILQATDITDLYNQWQADFNTWFQNLKDQLTSNVVTNLQAQIDALGVRTTATETKVATLETTSNSLVAASNNSSDAGNIMTFGLGYNKTVTNALPCTGGYYSPTAYPTLFDRIGYTYGAQYIGNVETISLQSTTTLYSTVYAVDQFNGDIYRAGSVGQSSESAIYVERFNKNGVFIEQINPSLKYYGNTPSLAVNDSNVWVMSSLSSSSTYYYHYYRSKNGASNTYSRSVQYGNGQSFYRVICCGSKIIHFYSVYGGSGSNQWQYYDILAWNGTQIQRYEIKPTITVGSGGVSSNFAYVTSNSDIFDGYYVVQSIYYHVRFNTANNTFTTNQVSKFPDGNGDTHGFLYNGYTCYFNGLRLIRLNTDGTSTVINTTRSTYSTSGGCDPYDTFNIFEQKYLCIPKSDSNTIKFFITDLTHKTTVMTAFGWPLTSRSYFDPTSGQLVIKNKNDINFSRFTLTKANIKFGVPTGDPNYQYDEYIRF